MGRLIRDFPFATILAFAGFFIGIALLFSSGFFMGYGMENISGNPISSLLDYLKNSFSWAVKSIFVGAGFGLALGAVFGLIGFLIDFLRKQQNSGTNYGGTIQKIGGGYVRPCF